jgi:hypothetical protein
MVKFREGAALLSRSVRAQESALLRRSARSGSLAGATDDRGPLEQGADFFDDVDNNIVPGLAPGSMASALYVIVSYQDIPVGICNSLALRAKFWGGLPRLRLGPSLEARTRRLSARTAFVSIRDLETAVTIADAARGAQVPFDIAGELHAWWARAARSRLAPSFRDYLLARYPQMAGHSLPRHSQALTALFDHAEAAAFGGPI